MMDWQARKAVGDRHEETVMRELALRGWAVQAVGQGSYPEAIRQALRRTDSPLRQFPDILAACGPAVVAIDAKTSMPGRVSGRFAVSRKCLTAGLQFQGQNIDVPLYYVFGDLTVLTPAEIACYPNDVEHADRGAYVLIRPDRAHTFDEVFGHTHEPWKPRHADDIGTGACAASRARHSEGGRLSTSPAVSPKFADLGIGSRITGLREQFAPAALPGGKASGATQARFPGQTGCG
jgi:hypothetical protein